MAKIFKHVASGTIRTGGSTGSPQIEIWSCSMHSVQLDSAEPVSINAVFAAAWQTFFTSAGTKISNTCQTTEIKSNVIDPMTGLQITDPTEVIDVSYFGGGTAYFPPTFQSCRVSLDNETRNRRARGGFYLPRVTAEVTGAGRYESEDMAVIVTRAQALLDSFHTDATATGIGVYSRVDQAFYGSSRVRVGNVPDVVRRRKNDLDEIYSEGALVST